MAEAITVENNAREALEMARQLLRQAIKRNDPAIAASRRRQVRYWEQFIADREVNR